VDAHRSLFLTEIIKTNPPLQGLIIGHMMQHLQFLANQLAEQQLPSEIQQQQVQLQQLQQTGQVPPEELQPLMQQIQTSIEQVSSPILAQLTQDLLLSIGQGNEEDPLVKIRQQELDLRKEELQADKDQFAEREKTRRQDQLLESEIAKQRIDTTKEVADDKLALALTRLQQQADLKLQEMSAKFGGIQ
jgi:hypothetical protein